MVERNVTTIFDLCTDRRENQLLFAHPWREGDPDQQSFGTEESTDGLAPRFFPALDECPVSSRFQFRRRFFNTLNIELKPGLGEWYVSGPDILAKTRLRRLRKRPQGKTLCPFQRLSMKITAGFLFERNPENPGVELTTCRRVTDNRTEARNEQDFCVSDVIHGVASCLQQHNYCLYTDRYKKVGVTGSNQSAGIFRALLLRHASSRASTNSLSSA